VHCKSLGEEVISHASHLDGIGSEELASVDEAAPLEGNWIVTLCLNEHSNDSFVSIDYEIASHFRHIFLLFDQVLLIHTIQVAVRTPYHNWNVSQVDGSLLFSFVVKLSQDISVERC
jgi:hypothetical protein